MPGERGVGDRLVAQREHERALEVGVDVAEPQRSVAGGDELLARDLGDLEVALDRGRQILLLPRR